jgi:hypothetical protein
MRNAFSLRDVARRVSGRPVPAVASAFGRLAAFAGWNRRARVPGSPRPDALNPGLRRNALALFLAGFALYVASADVDAFAEASGKRVVKVPLPAGPATGLVDKVPGMQSLMEFPAQAIPYFTQPTHYLSDNTQRDLAGTGIEVLHWSDYIPRLVAFTREHMDMTSAAMI